MIAALTRRAALRGSAAAALGLVGSACSPAKGHAAPIALSANDARLVALADEYEALDGVVNATHSTAPGYEALIDRYLGIEMEMAETPADTMAGVLAKARACQSNTLRDCVEAVSLSVADDVWRLLGPAVAS